MIFLHRHPGNFRLPHDRWSHRQSFRFGTGCPDDENLALLVCCCRLGTITSSMLNIYLQNYDVRTIYL